MLVRNQLFVGYVNGPNHPVPQLTVWDRFKGVLHNYLSRGLCRSAVACLALISGRTQPTAFYTVTVLWLMRWSAKLNLFLVFGRSTPLVARSLELPGFLFENRPFECFLPFRPQGFLTYLIFKSAATVPDLTQQLSLYLVGSLMLLASIEHLFLMFPVNEAALWRWARANEPQLRAVRVEKDEI